jgi:diguanylate cyclase (GGDEF)-like protein
MTAPDHSASAGDPRQRERLVRRWATQVRSTTHVPVPPVEFERQLAGLLDDLLAVLRTEPHLATECGAALVEYGCTDPTAIRSTMDVLGAGLLALPELLAVNRLPEKVVQVLGVLAAGYAEALRTLTFTQQETLSLTLRRTLTDVQQTARTVTGQFDRLVAAAPTGIAVTDQSGHFLRTNKKLVDILGYPDLADHTVFDLIPGLLDGKGRQPVTHRDGSTSQVSVTLLESIGDQWLIMLEDRSEMDLLHGQLTHQTLYDMLTRLPNRQFFLTTLERRLRTVDLAVHHLDLDGFARVTHGLGRTAGDQLLVQVGQKLTAVLEGRKGMVARLWADEFLVMVENPPEPEVVVASIVAALGETTACVGVVHRPRRATGAADVLEAAEFALARARRVGPGQWALSDPYQDTRDREAYRRALPENGHTPTT